MRKREINFLKIEEVMLWNLLQTALKESNSVTAIKYQIKKMTLCYDYTTCPICG